MSSINKIVLKGTSRISLHERFTKLKFDIGRASTGSAPAVPAPSLVYQHTPMPVKIEDGGYIRSDISSRGRQERQSYSPTPIRSSRSRPRARTPDQPRYSANRRMRSLSPMERMRRNISPEPRRSRRDDPNPNLFSTNRVKKKSVYLRLGVRPERSLADRMSSGIPVWTQSRDSGWGGGRQLSRSQSSHSLNRWNSQGSLENSYNDVPRYQQNNNRRFRGGRGGQRNFAYNRQGRWRYGQGWFGGQRRGGFRGNNRYNKRGRGRGARGAGGAWTNRFQRQPTAKREDLDAELDAYMSNTRGVLDTQLDGYMSQVQS